MTIENATTVLTLLTALGCGVVGGILFAFSAFLMRAFGSLPAPQGIAVMQTINVVILNPMFLTLFVGTAGASVVLGVRAVIGWPSGGALWSLAGAVLYLVGVIGITAVCNIPRNDTLARVDPASDAGARLWARYLVEWTAWNHVRTVAAIAAAACFILGL